ncbi:mitochondrial outer membrane translocase complex, subunit Tom5 [Xylaria bambusicola]|uniref:mitochondrial outer membrane translocase complex, subunit Tom5 n=1 Tax=Xylaria bambusicola TaxID=326684 RepID=UPI002008CF33|nr:mitochondrial outer membrane translocase complex, subunit Tom5 [Xylaria bambusicola]KAI0521049.1 mitochondrial outer membrane translocase complex, subunit Tom5 [Xylaria bambusicola]
MFGGFAPPQLSAEEMRQLEGEANFTVKSFFATALVLYISPFVVDAVSGFL